MRDKIFKFLIESKQTISFVESFTGGGLCKDFVTIPGASKVLLGGLTAYQDKAKVKLGIDEKVIKNLTAVSGPVALEMSTKGSLFFDSDYCMSTTGWAGPDGGTIANPVGTVYFSVYGNGIESVVRRTIPECNDRESFMELAIEDAWTVLWKVLMDKG